MNIVWKLGVASVRDVLLKLNKDRHLAYTTIMTIMVRMVDKGALVRKLKGSTYFYRPKKSKEIFIAASVHNIFSSAVASFGSEAVVYFAKEIQNLSPRKKKKLLNILGK